MGGGHSNHSRRRSSSQHDFTTFVNQKEYVFIAMQSDIDRAFAQKNRKGIEDLAGELVAHIMDLKQVPQHNLSPQEADRVRKLIYSFEISFAKLKSVYNCDTSFLKKKKEVPQEHVNNSNFYSDPIEPDIVSDLNRIEPEDSVIQRRKAPPVPTSPKPEVVYKPSSSYTRQGSITFDRQSLPNPNNELITRSLPLNRQSLPNTEPIPKTLNYDNSKAVSQSNLESTISEIENAYHNFVTRASIPVEDINEYYQMDKTVFFLYTQLSKLVIMEDNFTLKERKEKLSRDLVDFRGFLGKKAAEFRDIEDAIGVLDESIYANDSKFNTFKSQNDPGVPVTDLDDEDVVNFELIETEVKISKIESDFESIKSKAYKPVANIKEYYVIDVDLTDLHTDLKSLETYQNIELESTKNKLLNSIMHFKELMDKKVGQFEEIQSIEEDLNTLNIMFDSCSPNDFPNFKERALEIQVRIENTTYFKNFEHKKHLFEQKLKSIFDQINLVESDALIDKSFEPIYGNLEEHSIDSFEVLENNESIISNKANVEHSHSDENDPIYSNFEEIRQGITHQDLASIDSANIEENDDRNSLYSNIDIVKQHLGGSTQKLADNSEEHRKKPPRPLPRNYEEKLIIDLSRQWKRLNEICDSGKLSQKEVEEVEGIKRQLEMTRNLFQRKIDKIFENFLASVDL